MKHRCRASEAGSVEAGRAAVHRFFLLIVAGSNEAASIDADSRKAKRWAFHWQPNRASQGVQERFEQPKRINQGGQERPGQLNRANQSTQERPEQSNRASQAAQERPRQPNRASQGAQKHTEQQK